MATTSRNVSVVLNYEGHNAGDSPGYIQLTRSAGRVYLVVDGHAVGSMSAADFARTQVLSEGEQA